MHEEIRRGRLTAINDRLLTAAVGAVERLSWLVDHGESHAVQARAAVGLLAHARQYVETTELEAKVREIEDLLAEDLGRAPGRAAMRRSHLDALTAAARRRAARGPWVAPEDRRRHAERAQRELLGAAA